MCPEIFMSYSWNSIVVAYSIVVQSYWACFGLYPSSCMVQNKPNSSVQHKPSSESFQVYSIVIHFGCAVWGVLNDAYRDRWIGRGEPTAWSPRWPDLNPLDFYLWEHLKTLVYAAPVDNEDHLNIALWMPVRLSVTTPDAAVHNQIRVCRGVHWISWGTFWAFITNDLFQL
jgi:hypothetical protein